MLDTCFETVPVSLQTRIGMFFLHKYTRNTVNITNAKIHGIDFSNRNQLGPP